MDVISANKLYSASFEGFKLSEERPEVKAWTDIIALKNIPINKMEYERLKQFEYNPNDKGDEKKIMMKKNSDLKKKREMVEIDESNMNLLNHSQKVSDFNLSSGGKGSISGHHRSKTNININIMDLQELEPDSDEDFLQLTDLIDMDKTYLNSAIEKFDDLAFDSFTYCQILSTHSMHYICYKIFKMYNLFEQFHIPFERLINFAKEMQNGYFVDNSYHNVTHIVDSMQAMHYLMSIGNVKRFLKKHDILSIFVADIVHDYEHPGYSNQFVIRTKHPLAIRYSDLSVLENHHLASAFTVMLAQDNNIFENLPLDIYNECRDIIIDTVLNTDLSKHFTLITEIKTKLGNNFPTD